MSPRQSARPRRALICGSLAFDTIMVFEGRFAEQILPDQIHILNVAFLVPSLRREFGGCAGNIAYNLKLLGDAGVPMATVGRDFAAYAEWLAKTQVSTEHVRIVPGELTAQAFITTDLDDNQITAFHPGAMQSSHLNHVTEAADVAVGIVAPDGREGMLMHAREFRERGVPFIFDPGQGLPMFDGEELRAFLDAASWVAVNDYEWQMLKTRTGLGEAKVIERVEALIVTKGAAGSVIHTSAGSHEIPAAPARAVVDPTGCGDAYRAGLLHGLLRGLDWPTTGRVASLMGARKIASRGTQNHSLVAGEFRAEYRAAFGVALPEGAGP